MSFFRAKSALKGPRVYVQEGIYDEFVRKSAEKAKSWVGWWETLSSPMFNKGLRWLNIYSNLDREWIMIHFTVDLGYIQMSSN